MLDHHRLADADDPIWGQLARRRLDPEVAQTTQRLIQARRTAISEAEALRQQANAATQTLKAAVQAKDTAALEAGRTQQRELKARIRDAEAARDAAEQAFSEHMLLVPNAPADDVPEGSSEADNREERRWGEPRQLDFAAQPHWSLGEGLGILDFAQAASVSGARFAVTRGLGARLERALAAYMLDLAHEHGYTEVGVPLLVRPETMQAAGQYPKFIGESFETRDGELVLIPTSEVPLVGLHQNSVLEAAELPRRYTAHTPCFRREAGAAGRDTRGLIRLHQFNKVELVAITAPEDSVAEHERLRGHAEAVLQGLELPYRAVTLCTGDLGFAAQKTYDLEVWLPGQGQYREISSISNCGDFQARRAQMRYRDAEGKMRFPHTLNGSAVAVGRAFLAVLENHQQADGSVAVPRVLVPYMNGVTRIALGT
jgi:seryl-tRNA synthetase